MVALAEVGYLAASEFPRADASNGPYKCSLGQYRIILSADTASEVRQMLSQKRR